MTLLEGGPALPWVSVPSPAIVVEAIALADEDVKIEDSIGEPIEGVQSFGWRQIEIRDDDVVKVVDPI